MKMSLQEMSDTLAPRLVNTGRVPALSVWRSFGQPGYRATWCGFPHGKGDTMEAAVEQAFMNAMTAP